MATVPRRGLCLDSGDGRMGAAIRSCGSKRSGKWEAQENGMAGTWPLAQNQTCLTDHGEKMSVFYVFAGKWINGGR